MWPLFVIIGTLVYMSFCIHKGYYFKNWSKDTKNGFHTATMYAIAATIFSFVLNYFVPIN